MTYPLDAARVVRCCGSELGLAQMELLEWGEWMVIVMVIVMVTVMVMVMETESVGTETVMVADGESSSVDGPRVRGGEEAERRDQGRL